MRVPKAFLNLPILSYLHDCNNIVLSVVIIIIQICMQNPGA